MPKFELHKVAFISSDLTDTVVLSTILEGASGATRAFVEEEPESFVQEDNQTIIDGQVFTFTMSGKPNTQEAQLTTWADAGTKLTIVGYAYGEFLQIENAIISKLPDLNERRVWKISAKKTGVLGYSGGKLDTEFMMSKNGLNMHYWQEGTTSGVAAGWSKTGGTTAWDDVNKEQDFSTTGVTVVYLQRDIYFPFPKQLTFFANFTAVSVTTGVQLQIQAFDENDSAIGSTSTEDVSSAGVASVSRTLPEGTVYVRLRVKIAQNDSVSFKNPGLSIGTSTDYIAQ